MGRPLVLTKDIGKPATGAALEIFLDVSGEGTEIAEITYRNKASLVQLIKSFLDRYKLNISSSINIDVNFATTLNKLNSPQEISQQAQGEFVELRKTLSDIIIQFENNSSKELKKIYSLENSCEIDELITLIDEHSSLNTNPATRIIGLIKTVTYHIKPENSVAGVLELPSNVCLVDLPGLDGSALHDIIITEGIQEADAVIFLLKPPRILGRGDSYLLDRVRRDIGVEGSIESSERIFLVLNAKDSIMVDNGKLPVNLPRDMNDLMEILAPGYANHPSLSKRGGDYPYFIISAWTAYASQQKLKGKTLSEKDTYESKKIQLGIKDANDQEVLEESQVPKLVQELIRFTRERRIPGQINDGKQMLDLIINSLATEYTSKKQELNNQGRFSNIRDRLEESLKERQESLNDIVYDFRLIQKKHVEDWRKQLKIEASSICDDIDKNIKQKLPQLWKKNFSYRRTRFSGEKIGKSFLEPILDDIQLYLWRQVNFNLPRLSSSLISACLSDLEAYQISQKIANGCYGNLDKAVFSAGLKQFVNTNTNQTLENMAKRIAVTHMTQPSSEFTAKALAKSTVKPDVLYPELFECLSSAINIPKLDLSPEDFNPLVSAIRKLYESFVMKNCVDSLLNLYLYEITLIEDYLFDEISKHIQEIRESSDPLLQSRIRESLKIDPDWGLMELLERKLIIIRQLKTVN